MYCARCGSENPDDGKFCRKCGGRIGLVDETDSASGSEGEHSLDSSSRRSRYASGAKKFIFGLFLLVAGLFVGIPLKGTQYADLTLLPAMLLIVWAMADFIRLRISPPQSAEPLMKPNVELKEKEVAALPPESTEFLEVDLPKDYETGEMVPPSVTENTTRKLEMDPDSETEASGKDYRT